ncbi:MAG: hypothetical protein KC652_07165 [Cyanobacteria bacterium HKST-UBA01]|nr:hypothetical protein [Cyanobacteria bacterium HKST-UBA01]
MDEIEKINNPEETGVENFELAELQNVSPALMPVQETAYGKLLAIGSALFLAVIGIANLLHWQSTTTIPILLVVVIASFIYALVILKPGTQEAEALLLWQNKAINTAARLNVKRVTYGYSSTVYYNFTLENKEISYETTVTACKTTVFAMELLESHLEGPDVRVDPLTEETYLDNVTVIANPESTSDKPLVLVIWRSHLIWCRGTQNFSLEALQTKSA